MMKNSTLFIVKKFISGSICVSELSANKTGKSSAEKKSADLNPSAQTIRKILDFALAYDVVETKTAGHVEMNLN